MSSKQYDIAIIGGSLSARITATLLAKLGNKVIFLRNSEARAPAWFHSSIFLEKLLGILGGRSCFVDQQPIQVLSERARLTLSTEVPLEDELHREFGQDVGAAVNNWLSSLQQVGTQLEELFWNNGGLPWPSLKGGASFKLLCLRRRVNLNDLEAPFSEKLDELPQEAREFVKDLLQGLAVNKVTELSYSRAAMLWAQALRPENLVEPDFSNMLKKRFEQFHGAKASLDDLEKLDHDGSRWTGGKFKSGASFTAKHFLLGDKRWSDLFKDGGATLPKLPDAPRALRTSDLGGQLSPLLGTRVICGGTLPLRIALEENEGELQGLVLSAASATEEEIRKQLEQALPFAQYQMEEITLDNSQQTGDDHLRPLANLPIRISSNLYCADRTALLPEMGAAGAAMLAWTICKNLGNKNADSKD